jgi:hypothetical protein
LCDSLRTEQERGENSRRLSQLASANLHRIRAATVCDDRDVEDVLAVAIALVAKHPAVTHIELAGSRSRGTHDELSDWDFAVQTSDFGSFGE